MRGRSLYIQLAVAVVALIAGVLLGRATTDTGAVAAAATHEAEAAARDESPSADAGRTSEALTAFHETRNDAKPAAKQSLDAILAQRDVGKRTSELEAYINSLGASDFAAALKRIRQIPGSNQRELASRLLAAKWATTDPEGALQFAASNRGYEYLADNVFEELAATDAQAALARAQGIPNQDLRYNALRGVLSFMAGSDPAGAVQLAQTMGNFPGNEPLSSVVYRQWAAADPQAAAAQASQAAQDGDGGGWRSPTGQVLRTWASQDPTAAANWALSMNDPEAQARSIGQVMRQWGRENPTAAANWLNGLPPGQSHDSAVAALAFSIAPTDPQSAVGWLGSIPDETARNNALQRLSREVMWRDPTNGASVLQAAGVPPNLITPPRRGQPPGP